MHPAFPASAGVALKYGSHFFLLHRSDRAKHWPNYWGFPGGKIESGEKPFLTAQRELLEETGVHIEEIDIVKQIHVVSEYIDGKREYTLYLCETWNGMPENLESRLHADAAWFSVESFPEPMIPHIREAFFAMLSGKRELLYDGRRDIFE